MGRVVAFSLGEMGHRTMLWRRSAVLRHAVVMCRPRITPDHCWHQTPWPALQPSLPPGHQGQASRCFCASRGNSPPVKEALAMFALSALRSEDLQLKAEAEAALAG